MENNQQLEVTSYDTSTSAMIFNPEYLGLMLNIAKAMAGSTVSVPKHLVGKENDCLAVVMQAMQWKMNPFVVAQKTHLVNGTLGYEAQLVNAVAQASGAIKGRFHYEYTGEGEKIACRVGAVINGERDMTWGEWLHLSLVKVRNSPLWVNNPKQQLGYLQVKNWCRIFCPGAIMGVYTQDELEPELKVINPVAETSVDEKTASVLSGLSSKSDKKQPPIDELPTITLDEFKKALSVVVDKPTQEHARGLIGQLSGDDRIEARRLYDQFVADAKARAAQKTQPITDEDRIKACKNQNELNGVLEEFSAAQLDKHEELIVRVQAEFDPFGDV
jgi:hypothetical protein